MTSKCNDWTIDVFPPNGGNYQVNYQNTDMITFQPPGGGTDIEICVTLCDFTNDCPELTRCEWFYNLCRNFAEETEPFPIDQITSESLSNTLITKVRSNPNPFSSSTTLEFELEKASKTTIEVYNLLGQVIWSNETALEAGTHYFPLENLPESTLGVLTYIIKTEETSLTGKLLKF